MHFYIKSRIIAAKLEKCFLEIHGGNICITKLNYGVEMIFIAVFFHRD